MSSKRRKSKSVDWRPRGFAKDENRLIQAAKSAEAKKGAPLTSAELMALKQSLAQDVPSR